MKKLLLVTGLMVASLATYAQGTLNFANFVTVPPPGTSVNAPIFNIDGTTRLAGSQFQAILYGGINASSLVAIAPSVAFLTGAGAGYFIGGQRIVPNVPGNTIGVLQVRAWDSLSGATWDTATIRGQSPLLTTLSLGQAPATPPNMVGLQSFSLVPVPEPSTIALAILGAAGLFLRRRK